MLRGYSNPLSPTGEAALVDPTPHHISAEAIQIVFRIDEKVAQDYLPPPLKPIEGGLAFAYVADMVKVPDQDPEMHFHNPERTQYMEGIVGLYCEYEGMRGRYSPYIWVTRDWSMLFGHIMGWGKKIGNVHLTKIHAVNPAMGELKPGMKLRGVVDRHGYRVLDIGIELEEKLPDDGVPAYGNRTFLLRYFPSVGPEVPPVHQLLVMQLTSVRTVDAWKGRGFVKLGESDNEALLPLQPKEIVGAYYFKRGWTTSGQAQLLRDYVKDPVSGE